MLVNILVNVCKFNQSLSLSLLFVYVCLFVIFLVDIQLTGVNCTYFSVYLLFY